MTAEFPSPNDMPGLPEEKALDRGPDSSSPGLDLDVGLDTDLDADLDAEGGAPEPLDPDFAPEDGDEAEFDFEPELADVEVRDRVYLRAAGDRVLVVLPPPLDRLDIADFTWQEIGHQLSQRLKGGERFWSPDTRVTLVVGDRLLDNTQLQDLEETLADSDLALSRVQTGRRETAIAAATAGYSVEQRALRASRPDPALASSAAPAISTLAEPLYLRTTVRSGVEVRHPGTAIVFGDVNPGGTIVADGDIVVWGKLRGLVHAGAKGNVRAIVAALQMEPTQIRIADTVARVSPQNVDRFHPEVAYVTRQGIRISRAEDFSRQR
ncbi:MAG: septum site-determining protein MinC [Geitlerinemataceae cyanobacterium]